MKQEIAHFDVARETQYQQFFSGPPAPQGRGVPAAYPFSQPTLTKFVPATTSYNLSKTVTQRSGADSDKVAHKP